MCVKVKGTMCVCEGERGERDMYVRERGERENVCVKVKDTMCV